MNPIPGDIQVELARRHRAAATTVAGLFIATILLSAVAFLGKNSFHQQANPVLNFTVRLAIAVLGLGAIAWRRTKFSPMRLQDIGGLSGATGILTTLEKTTIQIAFFAASIAAIGFIGTLLTGNEYYTYGSSIIGVALLIYCFPVKSSWFQALVRFAPPSDSPTFLPKDETS
ncbi:MAG: hypothetical protein ABR555_06040 [Pyrinomonadaceae bacterium]